MTINQQRSTVVGVFPTRAQAENDPNNGTIRRPYNPDVPNDPSAPNAY